MPKKNSVQSRTRGVRRISPAGLEARDEGPRLIPLSAPKEPSPRLDQYLKLADIALQKRKK
jgi:hypothetical protein